VDFSAIMNFSEIVAIEYIKNAVQMNKITSIKIRSIFLLVIIYSPDPEFNYFHLGHVKAPSNGLLRN